MENVVRAWQHRIAKIEDRTAKIEDQIQEILGQNGPVTDIGVGSLRIPEDEFRRSSEFLGPTSNFRQASSILHAVVPTTPTYPLALCFLPQYAHTGFATAVRETTITITQNIAQNIFERFPHSVAEFHFDFEVGPVSQPYTASRIIFSIILQNFSGSGLNRLHLDGNNVADYIRLLMLHKSTYKRLIKERGINPINPINYPNLADYDHVSAYFKIRDSRVDREQMSLLQTTLNSETLPQQNAKAKKDGYEFRFGDVQIHLTPWIDNDGWWFDPSWLVVFVTSKYMYNHQNRGA